ncbi:hypothetical protein QLX08_010535 [Tetragonisca angustula]|uniref:MICAL-like protein 2 n=2 Tax=Tetragonisca angustula TaxID=166442 RepID=A0AAW0ZBZ8_9HYME
MGEKRGTKALEFWCRRITEGYPDVNVQNMTTSWRDGLAFCAMIHHFRPDLIDFDSLDKNDVYGNNELAFRIAEQHLGIPALLDAEDMASCSVPDRLSILTYLSQFYQTFSGSSPARLAVSRTSETVEEKITQVSESPKEKGATCLGSMRKDLCVVCGLPIFLAEKLVLAHVAYHRTCFRCARCTNQLTIGNYYETEDGQYCCETCPDEDIPIESTQSYNYPTFTEIEKNNLDSSFKQSSNEENTDKKMFNHNSVSIEKIDDESLARIVVPDLIAQTSRLRLNFISNQLFSEENEQTSDDNAHTNENRDSIQGDGTNLKTEKQHKLDYVATCLNHNQLAISTSVASFHDTFEDEGSLSRNNDEKLLEDVGAESNCSIIEKRCRMFEKKEDDIERNKIKDRDTVALKLEIQTAKRRTESGKSSITDPDTMIQKAVISQDTLEDNVNSSNKHNSNASEDGKTLPVLSDRESSEHQTSISVDEDYPEDLNPFKSDEEGEEEEMERKGGEGEEVKIADKSMKTRNSLEITRDLTNPVKNVQETEKEVIRKTTIIPPKPAARSNFNSNKSYQHYFVEGSTKRRLTAPQINLNPFWSDEEDHDSDLESKEKASEIIPTPKPRTIKRNEATNTNEQKSSQVYDYSYIPNNCLRSPESRMSTGGAYRKKKPAPLPPNKKEPCPSDQPLSSTSKLQRSTSDYRDPLPRTTFKTRKQKPAPPPPPTTNFQESPISKLHGTNIEYNVWEDQKTNKDETNRNRQSFAQISCEENFHCRSYLDKSIEGKWKRKKGPAPPCPIPHRRKIKVMSLKDVKLELDEIELQQQGLEKQGVRLEQLIRSKCESGSRINDISLGADVEELVLELFTLVNEKNELFRRQAELMLLRRQQRLEEEHADVEYQIRCLMTQHESTKTDFDKQREEVLIQRLIEIVEKRNEIVDCLEMDRRREIEEDRSIHRHMDLFAAKNKNESLCNDMDVTKRKKLKQNKLKEKIREKKLKKILKKDIDKDVDETELTLKRTKRKWF